MMKTEIHKLGVPLELGAVVDGAGRDYQRLLGTFRDLPPVLGSPAVMALKGALEGAVRALEGLLNEFHIDMDDGQAHGSARVQWRVARVDIEVWDKDKAAARGKKP